jgi:hypothetical protein
MINHLNRWISDSYKKGFSVVEPQVEPIRETIREEDETEELGDAYYKSEYQI